MTDELTIEGLLEEERALVFESFDEDIAWALGCRIREAAAARALPVAMEVTHGLERVFLARMPGATPDNVDWMRRKAAVVHRFHHSSLYMRLLCEQHGVDFNARYRLPATEYAASGGGMPLVVRHAGLIGVAAVSGLPDVEDHRLVAESIRAVQAAMA
jgi:uncharacterized protein (UPF0303 family)